MTREQFQQLPQAGDQRDLDEEQDDAQQEEQDLAHTGESGNMVAPEPDTQQQDAGHGDTLDEAGNASRGARRDHYYLVRVRRCPVFQIASSPTS